MFWYLIQVDIEKAPTSPVYPGLVISEMVTSNYVPPMKSGLLEKT